MLPPFDFVKGSKSPIVFGSVAKDAGHAKISLYRDGRGGKTVDRALALFTLDTCFEPSSYSILVKFQTLSLRILKLEVDNIP